MVRTARPFEIEETQQFWLAGAPAASLGSELMETVDPSTGERIACVPVGTVEDVEARSWLRRLHSANGWRCRFRSECAFCGCSPTAYASTARSWRISTPSTAAIRSARCARMSSTAHGRSSTSRDSPRRSRVRRSLRASAISTTRCASRSGVVARILPYNHPALFMCAKIAAPLAAGNAVVVKPADQTPLSALRIASLSGRDLFPPGLLNVVTGDGTTTGRALVRHPVIERVAFTGGVGTGRAVLRDAADGVKTVTLELGGKNPMIVMPDADIARAVEGAVAGMNFHISAGQSCGSNSRILLHKSVHDDFAERLIAAVSTIRLGRAVEDDTEMGPLISAVHRDRVLGYVATGRSEGARQLTEERLPAHLDGGYFVGPTIFADVAPDMRIAREEIFGPSFHSCAGSMSWRCSRLRIASTTG